MDRGAWWAAVHGVAKSRTRLSNFPFTFHFRALEKEMATYSSVLPRDSGAWWADVYGVAKSQTQLTFTLTNPRSLQSCPTLCDLIDGSPPGSPVPEILQARTLEWVAISFSNA